MAVYLIRAGESGPVKIGKADEPKTRVIDLQCAHYEKLHLLRVWEGGEAEEKALHLRFADLRIRGEWFGFSRLMLGDVGLREIASYGRASKPAAPDQPMPDLLLRLGGQTAVARKLGLAENATLHWNRRGIPAKYTAAIIRLAQAEGFLVTPEQVLNFRPVVKRRAPRKFVVVPSADVA